MALSEGTVALLTAQFRDSYDCNLCLCPFGPNVSLRGYGSRGTFLVISIPGSVAVADIAVDKL